MKIAKYGLDNWVDPREYIPMDAIRQQFKLCICQYTVLVMYGVGETDAA